MTSGFLDFYGSSDLSRQGARQYASAVESAQLLQVDLSSTVIQHGTRSVVNCLAMEKHEYRYLLGGSMSGVVSLFDLEQTTWQTGPILPLQQHMSSTPGTVASIQWYPQDTGAFVTANMGGNVSIFDTNQFVQVVVFPFSTVVYAARMRAASGASQPLIAAALGDGTVRLCDPRTRDSTHILKGHSTAVTRVEWCPAAGQAHVLASAGMDGAVRVWDVRRAGGLKEAVLHSLDWRGDFRSAARLDTSKLHTSLLKSAPRFGHFGSAGGGGSGSSANPIIIHDASSIYQTHQHPSARDSASAQQAARAHDAAVLVLQYTSCGRHLLTAGSDRQLRLWQASTGELVPINYSDRVVPTAKLPFDICLAETGAAVDDLIVMPAAGGATVECNCNVRALNRDTSAATSSSAKPAIATKEGDMLLIPVHSSDGQPVRILKGHLDRVTSVVYRRPHQQIISAGKDGMVFLWEALRQTAVGKAGTQQQQSRHSSLYYGTAGGRYDFARTVLLRVQGEGTTTFPDQHTSISAATEVSSSAHRRELPVRETTVAGEVRAGDGPAISQVAGASACSAHTHTTAAAGHSDSSGDDWSDDDVVGAVAPAASVRGLQSGGSAQAGGRRKAARIVAEAQETYSGTVPPLPVDVSSSSAATAQAAVQRNSRSFVPPIIQQYLQEARTAAAVPSSSSSSSSSGGVRSSAQQVASAVSSDAALRTTFPGTWEGVQAMFETTITTTTSALAEGDASPAGAAARARPIPPSPAALSPPLTADQRYRLWLKQSRAKAGGAAGGGKK